MNEQVVAALRAARADLARPGRWWGGSAQEPAKSAICTSTALSEQNRDGTRGGAIERARGYVMSAIGVQWLGQLYAWNDKPERTLDEVLAVYDAAIHAAEADALHSRIGGVA